MAVAVLQVLFVIFPLLFVFVQTLPFPTQPTPGEKYKNCNGSKECWQRGQMPNTDGVCFEPLSTSPCDEGYWFILNEAIDNLQGHCVKKPCPEGLFPLKGGCVEEAEAQVSKCAGGPVFLNAAARLECWVPSSSHPLHALVQCSPPSTLPIIPARPTAVWTGNVQCAKDNNGGCIREVVIDDTNGEINADDIHES